MRIISDFVDYYDCIQRMGQDKTLVYLRRRVEEDVNKHSHYGSYHLRYDSIHIEFCGKLYHCFRMRQADNNALCYTLSDIDKFVESRCDKDANKTYFEGRNVWSSSSRLFFSNCFLKHSTEKHIPKTSFDVPIIVTDYYKGLKIKNASLREYEFYRIFNPVMAFQELSMYLGSMAVPMKPEPRMSNDDKIFSHGFDKYSFRKSKP